MKCPWGVGYCSLAWAGISMQGSKGGSRHAMGVVGLSEVQNGHKMSTWCVLASASSVGQMGRAECSRGFWAPEKVQVRSYTIILEVRA